jgi:hypothetical protein
VRTGHDCNVAAGHVVDAEGAGGSCMAASDHLRHEAARGQHSESRTLAGVLGCLLGCRVMRCCGVRYDARQCRGADQKQVVSGSTLPRQPWKVITYLLGVGG